jgi:hypothetical protein
MLFSWIRSKVRNAVLAGVSDAVDELDHGGDGAAGEAANQLRLRLGYRPAEAPPALAAPAGADADAEGAAGVASGNGRRTRR